VQFLFESYETRVTCVFERRAGRGVFINVNRASYKPSRALVLSARPR